MEFSKGLYRARVVPVLLHAYKDIEKVGLLILDGSERLWPRDYLEADITRVYALTAGTVPGIADSAGTQLGPQFSQLLVLEIIWRQTVSKTPRVVKVLSRNSPWRHVEPC